MKILFLYTFLVIMFVGKTVYQKQLHPKNFLNKNKFSTSKKLDNALKQQSQNFELHFTQALTFIKDKQLDKALEQLDNALVLLKKEQSQPIKLRQITPDNSITLDSFLHYYEYYISLYKMNIFQHQEKNCEVLEEFNNNCDLFTKQRAAYMLKAKSEWALGEEILACKSFQKAKTFRFPSKKDLESHIRLLAAANYKFDNQNIMQQSLKEYDYFKIRWQAFMQIEKNINAKKSMTKCQST